MCNRYTHIVFRMTKPHNASPIIPLTLYSFAIKCPGRSSVPIRFYLTDNVKFLLRQHVVSGRVTRESTGGWVLE